jgi:putative ABC transport system ATP-binding protein
LFKNRSADVDVPDMTSSALVDGPERGPEEERRDSLSSAQTSGGSTSQTAISDTGLASDPLASVEVPLFGTMHFDESVVGLTIADVSVVLVGDFPVAVPIPRSLAQQCGFTLLDVDDDVLLSIGVIAVALVSEPVPPRPKLPTAQRTAVHSSFESVGGGANTGAGEAVYMGVEGDVTVAPRSASEVAGEIGNDELAQRQQQLTDLAPALLASQTKFALVAENEIVDTPEQLWEKLATRSRDLAPASQQLDVLPEFSLLDPGDALLDQVDRPEALDEVADVARPFATSMVRRADVGFVEFESWPDVERRVNDREQTTSFDRSVSAPVPVEVVSTDTTSFLAVRGPENFSTTDSLTHPGLLSPFASDGGTPPWLTNAGSGSVDSMGRGFGDGSESFEGIREGSDPSEFDGTGWKTGMPVWPRLGAVEVDGVRVAVEAVKSVHVDVAKPLPSELAFGGAEVLRGGEGTSGDDGLDDPNGFGWELPTPTFDVEDLPPEDRGFPINGRPESTEDAGDTQDPEDTDSVVTGSEESTGEFVASVGLVEPESTDRETAFAAAAVWADNAVLGNIRLDGLLCDPGQLTVIFTRDPAERSALCRMLAGFERLDAGRLKVGPVFVDRLTAEQRSVREAGSLAFASSTPSFVRDLTVVENLELPLLITGDNPAEARQLVIDTLDDLDLAAEGDRLGRQLSSAERLRFGVLRAVLSAEVAILDDPGAAGPEVRNELLELVRVAIAAGIAVVYATSEFETSAILAGEPNAALFEVTGGALGPVNHRDRTMEDSG